ncbi:cytidylyltransferase domain-containing protein [Candidatus Nitrosotenuis aquarius]|uniref:cytidylyltransferase domain-containing protein n=1 Tax=Candidatus Nitrosotenuis aquarius TaxID=1846278 RepID=UPI000C1ECED3|nr:glycosyltransferase family protein [Candidatus Nitrosotenuis aquarius]
MRVIAVIQARLSSKRLPRKVMLDILGKPVIWHIYNRLTHCKHLSAVVISTGEYDQNKEICDFAEKNQIKYYSGSEMDLIQRLYQTVLKFDADALVRITSDCPLVDPKLVDELVGIYVKNKDICDLVTNCEIHSFPHGLDIEVYSHDVLRRLNDEIKEPDLREWFPLYITKNKQKFKILNIKNEQDLSRIRLTLDYPEDYDLIKKIYQNLANKLPIPYMTDILDLLKNQPDLLLINSKYVDHRNVDAPTV